MHVSGRGPLGVWTIATLAVWSGRLGCGTQPVPAALTLFFLLLSSQNFLRLLSNPYHSGIRLIAISKTITIRISEPSSS